MGSACIVVSVCLTVVAWVRSDLLHADFAPADWQQKSHGLQRGGF